MRREKHRGENGFTLIEILAVLTLLAFILMLVAPNVINQLQKGQGDAAKVQIASLKNVLNNYYLDNSTFPTTEQGIKALLEKPAIPPIPENWNGPYLEENRLPRDPWGRELHYVSPGIHNPQRYDIFTLGRDNAEGGTGINADLGNWEYAARLHVN
jgi:general secretion pathway protein G